MISCRDGMRADLDLSAIATLFIVVLLITQGPPVSAQRPSSGGDAAGREVAPLPASVPAELVFVTHDLGRVHEGHVSLSWKDIDGEAEYVVYEQDGNVLYRGTFATAFISGLSDGEYVFSVRALDADENVIAVSTKPAKVVVEHWPLAQAWVSFAIGAVVFVAVIVVIARGAWSSRRAGGRRQPEETA